MDMTPDGFRCGICYFYTSSRVCGTDSPLSHKKGLPASHKIFLKTLDGIMVTRLP